jgi:hypothetical protein
MARSVWYIGVMFEMEPVLKIENNKPFSPIESEVSNGAYLYTSG